jgi:hypothetical protein
MLVHAHDEHFKEAPEDHECLTLCGERTWVGVSRDTDIMSWKNEVVITTIMSHHVKAFVCIGTYPHPQVARNLVNSQYRMARFIRKHRDPFVARLYMANPDEMRRGRAGEVSMWLTYNEWLEKRAADG